MKPRCTVFYSLLFFLTASPVAAADAPFHFQYDIAPHLARAGCAAAECHGGATGRGGFKLSLFATNPRADFEAITQELDGRRVSYLHPEQSLILRKPTKQLKHGGGRVIARDDLSYAALAEWIRAGTPFAEGDAGKLTALEVKLADGQLKVGAEFETADGRKRSRDVTALARFESTDDRIAAVAESGKVTLGEPGEAWLIARYGGLAARVRVLQPFPAETATTLAQADHALDRVWLERLAELNLEATKPADPHQLLRRLYLDLTGRPPAPDEIAAFFALSESERVAQTIAKLLKGKAFADQLTRKLMAWFEVGSPEQDLKHTSERNARLRASLRQFAEGDGSLADFARDLLLQPSRRELVHRFSDPRDRAEFTARSLLGINISCARCHNHPLDKWSQAQHLKFSAFFTDQRPQPKNVGGDQSMAMVEGKFFLPGEGKAITPALLPISRADAGAANPAGTGRQQRLAQFITQDAADAFARNAANRVFGMMLGRFLVETPDDHRLSNPAIHEPVIDLLAEHLRTSGYQIRPLLQLIATSQLYATDSSPPDASKLGGDPQLRYLARRKARSMDGAQFRRALAAVTGVPLGRTEIPDTPLTQQLHLINSGIVQQALKEPGNQVDAIFDFESDPAQRLVQLYLLILSRPPKEAERREFLPLLSDRAGIRDLAFALIASREFGSIR